MHSIGSAVKDGSGVSAESHEPVATLLDWDKQPSKPLEALQ